MTAQEKIYEASKILFNSHPFYGILSLRVRKVIDPKVPTACMRLGDDKFSMEMCFNEDFVNTLPMDHIVGLVEHELLHMVNGHLEEKSYNAPDINHFVMNVSMDCEINQYIKSKNVSKDWITLEKVEKELGIKVPEKAGTWFYYKLLKPLEDKMKKQGMGTVDIHNDLSDNPMSSTVIDGIIENAAIETEKRRGTVPGNVLSRLEAMREKRKPVLDWKQFLRRFVQNSYKEHCITTRRRESRRFEDNPGLRHEPEFRLLVGIDSSGSVSDEELKEFFVEIDLIHKNKCDIQVLVCDTRIVQDFNYKSKESIDIQGRGGTSFEPIIDAYEKSTHTCLVYLTDGECSITRKLRKPVLWVLSSRGTDSYLKNYKTVKIRK